MPRLLIVAAAVLGGVAVLLGAEVVLASRGPVVDEFEVTSLAESFAPGGNAAGRPSLSVVWLGDSTAVGVGASGPAHSVSSEVGRAVAASRGVTVEVRVLAVSGAVIADVVNQQVPRLGKLRPDIVVISVGTNDTTRLTSVAAFRREYRRTLEALGRAGVPASRVVLVGVPDMGAPTRIDQPLRALSGLRGERLDWEVHWVAREKGAHYVDLFAGTSRQFREDPAGYFAADQFHPGDAGYALWAEVITPIVNEAVAPDIGSTRLGAHLRAVQHFTSGVGVAGVVRSLFDQVQQHPPQIEGFVVAED